jgi:arylsulfatase A-like enzyme
MRRGGALLIGLGLLAACGRDALPPEITIEQVVTELGPPLATDARVEGPGAAGARRGVLRPGERASGGGPLDAVVTPEPATLRFHVAVPPDSLLRFGAAVEGDKQRDLERSGVEFRVAVDGHEVFSRVVNPAGRRKDRRWIEGRVDLRGWAGQSVDLALETRAERPGHPLAGTAGWSNVRLVREERRKRTPAGTGPNVLLLLVDTLRADRLGIYGADRNASPALDRFAARGLVFDVAVSQASWTMPAVASVLTGLHPRSHGAVGPFVEAADDAAGGTLLPSGVVTLAELAQQVGVTTVGVSTNSIIGHDTNFSQGFETFIELPFDTKVRNYAPAAAANKMFLDWLDRARGVRFFAYVHYMEPHGPYAPPAALRPPPPPGMRPELASGWIQEYAQAVNEGRAAPPSATELDYLRRLYAGDVRSWDDAFADFLATLEARGVLDDTIVVVMADHGEEFLEHGNMAHGGHLYEETVRIPLVIVGPGVAPGRRSDMAQGVDLLPTLAPILGAPVPAGLPGRDLLATQSAGDVVSEIVGGFGDGGRGSGTVALRTARWKLIRPEAGDPELYDLANDPEEHTNLAATSPETAALVARLDGWAAAAPPPPHTTAADPTLRAKLRQLGYVE